MGSSGAEVPSTLAAAHGRLCGSAYAGAAAWQPGLLHHWQQGVGFKSWLVFAEIFPG